MKWLPLAALTIILGACSSPTAPKSQAQKQAGIAICVNCLDTLRAAPADTLACQKPVLSTLPGVQPVRVGLPIISPTPCMSKP